MRPTCVRSGSEALALLSQASPESPYDLALLDLDMGSTDGLDLARAIRSRVEGDRPRLVLLTSLGKRGDARMAREVGVVAYLTKPVRDRQLHDCLVAVMRQTQDGSRDSAEEVALPLITRHSLAETKAKVDLRILLAEDNIVNQKVAVRLFQRLGYRIDVVANGREVVEAFSRIRYDVVFMDCQMPEMDGFEATRVIRETEMRQWALGDGHTRGKDAASSSAPVTDDKLPMTASRVPIIALTANAMQGDRDQCLAAGMDDYVSKPISLDALAGALDRVSRNYAHPRLKNNQEAA